MGEIVPRFPLSEVLLMVQTTLVGKLPVPETVAVNCCEAPGWRFVDDGETETEVTVGSSLLEPPEPQPVEMTADATMSSERQRRLLRIVGEVD